MTRSLSTTAALILASACAQEVTVHIRGGDRPADSEFLYVAGPSAQAAQPNSLVLTGGSELDRFRIVMRNVRLQSYPVDGGSADSTGARIIGPNAYIVDIPGASLGGGTFTELIGSQGLGAKGFYEMDIDLSPVTEADVQAQPELAPLLGKTYVIEGHNPQGV